MTLVCDPNCWSAGRITSIADDAVLPDDTAVAGSSKAIASITGTAHAGSGGTQPGSDLRIRWYDLLVFSMARPDVPDPVYDAAFDRPLWGYRVSGHAVGWNVSGPCVDDGTPGELLLAGKPLTLPWGAYWLIVSTRAAGTGLDPSNHGLYAYVEQPAGVPDGAVWPLRLSDAAILNGMTVSGLAALGITGPHVIGFRVNKRGAA